jgi:two-component system response regulator AtoC
MTEWSRVLLAEDDPELRALLAAELRADAHEVMEAEDGVELMALVEAQSFAGTPGPTVVVTDVRMPRLSGLDVLAAYPLTCRSVPFILITAFGDDRTRAEAHALGANRVLEKPLDLTHLRDAVREAMPQ